MYYPARHPVVQTVAVQLRMKERLPSSTRNHDASPDVGQMDVHDEHFESQNAELPPKPD